MSVFFDNKKLLIITLPKSLHFNLPIEVNKILEHETKFTISHNESLGEY